MKKKPPSRQKPTRSAKEPMTRDEKIACSVSIISGSGYSYGTMTHRPFAGSGENAIVGTMQISAQKFFKKMSAGKGAGSLDILNQIEEL